MRDKISTSPVLLASALFFAVLSISFAAIFFRLASPTHPLTAAGIRLIMAGLLLSPILLHQLLRKRISKRLFLYGLLAGFCYAIHFGAWVSSLTLTSIAASVTLVTTTPLLLALIGWLSGRDRPSRPLWFAVALATIGVVLIGGSDLIVSFGSLTGDTLALLGAMAMAAYMLIGRRLGNAMQLWSFSAIATTTGGFLLLLTAWFFGIPLTPATDSAWLYLFLAALFPQLVGHTLLTWSLRHLPPSTVAMAVVGEPVGATILAWLWLGETVGLLTILGCGITLSAVLLALKRPVASF